MMAYVSIAVTLVSILLTLVLEGPRIAERLRAMSSDAREVRRKRASRARTVLLAPRPSAPEPPAAPQRLLVDPSHGLSRILKTLTATLSGGLIIPWTLIFTWFVASTIAGVKYDSPNTHGSAVVGFIIVVSPVVGIVWGALWLRRKPWSYIIYAWLLGAGSSLVAVLCLLLDLSLSGNIGQPTPVAGRGTTPVASLSPAAAAVVLAAVPAPISTPQPVPEMPSPAPSIPVIASPDAAICDAVAPTLSTGPISGPPAPTKPCGSDVAQCTSDIDSCRARAQRRDLEAAAQLGYAYMHGLGVGRDYTLAKNWSQWAVAGGNPLGQDTMGELYRLGEGGVPQDYQQAQELFAKAAAQDCALAENDLGDLYLYGKGVERNAKEAFKWYKQAADRNDAMGQNNVGYMYGRGFGVNKDSSAAQDWYFKSAKQGNPFAQDALGYIYQTGLGLDEDPALAFKCYKSAAEQGYPTAQFHLAELYSKGVGVDQNSTEAAKFYCEAAGLGNAAANRQVHNMGVDCSSLPVTPAATSPAAGDVSSPASSALSTPATSAESR
jgi:TPR repeat protein